MSEHVQPLDAVRSTDASPDTRKVIFASSLGTVFEWYDFFLYGALAAFDPREYLPGPALQSDEDLHQAAAQIGTTIFHPVGTCRMGHGPEAVVDAELRVHGIPGLRIADASIMPYITSGNTCSPTLMIAEKAAELILATSTRSPAAEKPSVTPA